MSKWLKRLIPNIAVLTPRRQDRQGEHRALYLPNPQIYRYTNPPVSLFATFASLRETSCLKRIRETG